MKPTTLKFRTTIQRVLSLAAVLIISLLAATSALAAISWLSIERVSVSSAGVEGDNHSSNYGYPDVSQDGRYVVFDSAASNLVASDGNGARDIFLRDRVTGTTELISVNFAGTDSGNAQSLGPSISNDGRYVAFESDATDLVAGDGNGRKDCFVRDRVAGTTERVSVDTGGGDSDGRSEYCRISGNGNFVVFNSRATDLVATDTNGNSTDIFLRDLVNDSTEIVSLDENDDQDGGPDSVYFGISDDGRYVMFSSSSPTVTPDTNGADQDIYVRDRTLGSTERVSVDDNGDQVAVSTNEAYISGNGRYVSWYTDGAFVNPDTNGGVDDIFVHDRNTGKTFVVSVDSNGVQGNGDSFGGFFSNDGRYITFTSESSNLADGDSNGVYDTFVHDIETGETVRASLAYDGSEPNADTGFKLAISGDGSVVVVVTSATNLVANDTNARDDVFAIELDLGEEASEEAEPGGPSSSKDIAVTGTTTLYTGRIAVLVPATAIPSGETNCRISITQKGDSGDYGFQLDDAVWDVKILCDSGEVNILFDAISVCIRPLDGNVSDKQVFHRHSGGFGALASTGQLAGYVCGQTRTLSLFTLGQLGLPATGFAPGGETALRTQPDALAYRSTQMTLNIPTLHVSLPIVGVPQTPNGWDVSWLGNSAGFLQGTAFPTLAGNTVLTAHVWGADNQPGPFAELEALRHGERFTINAWGQSYTYEVRGNTLYSPNALSPLGHADYDWVTLVTCSGFDEASGEYKFRRVVRAVLVEVQ